MTMHISAADAPRGRDSPALIQLFPLMITYAVGIMSATYIPVWVGAASTRYAIPVSQVGLIGSYALGAFALANILTAAVRSPGPTRIPMVVGLIAAIALNFLAATAPSAMLFALALIGVGVANGFLLAEVNARAAVSAAPARVFAGQLFVMMCFAAIFFAAAPRLLTLLGPGATFFFCGAASILALVSVSKLDTKGRKNETAEARPAFRLTLEGALLLAAPTLLFIAMNLLLPFLGAEASRTGVPLSTYSKALSIGALVNLAGPILAERLLRRRASWVLSMSVGIILLLSCDALITTFDSGTAFLTGIVLLPFFLLVLVPFYLTLLVETDQSGKLVTVSPAFFMIGTAVGPGVGGVTLDALGFPGLAIASIVTPLLALLATWGGALRFHRRTPLQ
jgi:predicted MFS family arabinose efflux permease